MKTTHVAVAIVVAFLAGACFSPTGAYREIRSDRHKPSASDLEGTWRISAETAATAAETGLPLAELQRGFVTFRSDGTCTADLFDDPCAGPFRDPRHHQPNEACRWEVVDGPSLPPILLTFGQEEIASAGFHRLESNPPILWDYICDPDWGEFVDFHRDRH